MLDAAVDAEIPSPERLGRSFRTLILVTSHLTGEGGRESVIASFLGALAADGRQGALAMLEHAADAEWEAALSGRLYVADIPAFGAVRRDLLRVVRFTRRVVAEVDPHAVLVTEPIGAMVVRLACALHKRAPVVLSWLHGDPRQIPHLWAAGLCDGHLAICEDIGQRLNSIRMGGIVQRRVPVSVVYNPVDLPARACARPGAGAPLHWWVIGRLNEQKQIQRVLHALAQSGRANWRLSVVGDGPERRNLEVIGDRLGIASMIEWRGWHAHPWDVVHNASALLLSSRTEGFPVVLLEAIARGVPVVAMDCDFGPREIVQAGVNGWLVDEGDIVGMAGVLRDLCDGTIVLPSVSEVVATAQRFSTPATMARLFHAMDKAGRRGRRTDRGV